MMMELRLILVVFLVGNALSFRLIPHFAQRSRFQTVLQSIKSFIQSPESYQTISTINRCTVSVEAIGGLIQRWGAEQAAIGTAVICEVSGTNQYHLLIFANITCLFDIEC